MTAGVYGADAWPTGWACTWCPSGREWRVCVTRQQTVHYVAVCPWCCALSDPEAPWEWVGITAVLWAQGSEEAMRARAQAEPVVPLSAQPRMGST